MPKRIEKPGRAPARPGALDPRLLKGMAVTPAELSEVFTEHYGSREHDCSKCGAPASAQGCASLRTARELLTRNGGRRAHLPGVSEWVRAALTERPHRAGRVGA